MRKPDFRYWVLWLFLLGIIFIVFLQVISGYNVTRLMEGNKSLTDEMQVQNDLRKLQSNVVKVESDIRGTIITNNTNPSSVDANMQEMEPVVQRLKGHFSAHPTMLAQLEKLENLIDQKNNFNQKVLTAFRQQGKSQAEALVSTGQGRMLRDSIEQVISTLDSLRQTELCSIVGSIENRGRLTRIWGFIIGIIALLSVVSAFWYTLNHGRQQQKMIELLNESDKRNKELANMKEQFLANMSHEIRTPMNAILGFTNLLRRSTLNNEQRQYVQNIHSAGENLLALVNDILDLSKIEAGMMSLEETRFSLHSLMSSVGAMFSEKVKEKQLQFAIHIDKDVPDILSGDAVRLTQILVNLISNAVKFTEQGKVEVDIKMLEQTEENVCLRMAICDTGIGISSEKLQTIFERFQQADTETTRRFGGTGLGLAIVKQLVSLQNGTIDVKSKPGKGSEFVVELCYKIPNVHQLYTASLAATQEEAVSLQKITVLIAEDNVMNQQLISHLMKGWGIDFKIVKNGKEVIEELKQRPYSIILMDIQMPEMDGYKATDVIRNDMKLCIPIIAMTAHAMTGEKEKCLRMGMNDYVSKPIKETVLYNMIGRHAQIVPDEEKDKENTSVNNHQLVNLTYLEQLSGGDKTFERQILEQFVIQLPQELQRLQEAVEKKDFDAAKQTAHSLKSTVGYIGLSEELHLYLDRIEKDGMKKDDTHFKVDLSYVKTKCTVALAEVETILQQEIV